MNNIADANATEMRGWVMLMLQRAAENVNPSECNDPAVLLACSLGSDSCPAACVNKSNTENEDNTPVSNINDMPIAGDLTIAVADYSSEVKSVPVKGTVVFNAVDFKASEKVVIESVKLERSGLSDKSAIKGVWFEKDGVAVSAKASLSTDGTVTTRFYNNYSVNGTDTLDLVVELTGSNAGSEIAFKIIDATTTAKNVSANTQTSTYRTTNYTVANVEFASQTTVTDSTTVTEYKVGDSKSFEIGKFKLTNDRKGSSEDRNIIIKSLKLKNDGTLDLGDVFSNVYVVRDSKTISKKVELDGKNMTIYFDDEELISGKSNQYTIFAEVSQLSETGKTVQLKLNKESELVANEKTSNFRVTVTGKDVKLKPYMFNGGKITFTNDSSLSNTVNAADGSSDVVIARGTLTVSEPIKFDSISISATETVAKDSKGNTISVSKDSSAIIKDLKFEFGGSSYYATASCNGSSCTYTYDEEIYVSKTSDFRILVNVRSGIANEPSVTFGKIASTSFGSSEKKAGTYDNGNEDSIKRSDIAGTVKVAKVVVKAGKFNITNKSSATQKVALNSSDEVTIFDGEITAKEGTVSINELVASGVFAGTRASGVTALANGLLATEAIDLTLSVNGDVFATKTLRGGSTPSVTFSSLGDVKSGDPMKIKITAQPNIAVTGNVVFNISSDGTDAQGNKVSAVGVNAAQLQITNGAEISLASSNTKSAVVKDGSNTEIISFTTTVKNGTYDLGEVVVALESASPILNGQSLTLEIDGTAVDSTPYSSASSNTGIVFDNLNETIKAGQHTIAVKTNLNATNSNSSFKVESVTMKSTAEGDTGKKLTTNALRLVAKAYPTISATTSNEDLILTITNPSDSEENIDIKSFGIDGKVVNVYFNGTQLDLTKDINDEIAAANVSLAAGNKVELRIQAAKSSTVTVNAIKFDAGDQHGIIVNSDYNNIGNWSNFKVSAGDKGSDPKVELTASKTYGTSSMTAAKDTVVNPTAISAELDSNGTGIIVTYTPSHTTAKNVTYAVTAYSGSDTAGSTTDITVSTGGILTVAGAKVGTYTITVTSAADTNVKTTVEYKKN